MGSSQESLVGQVLSGRYVIDEQLGAGGISVVYKARDRNVVGRKVAVKVLLREWQSNDHIRTKFMQEAEALSRVRHPNVVELFDAGELPDGQPYIVLEFIEGINLRSLIRPQGCELERSARIIKQIGSVLTAAHNKGIYHRDLKPENIMLRTLDNGEEQVKLIDFGIAKVRDSVLAPETKIVATAGTIAYMSPEQLSEAPITAASDIYALGIVAFELMTGRKPFNPKTPFQLLEMQRAGFQPMPGDAHPQLPPAVQRAFMRALSFDPDARYQRARDFSDELYELVTGKPVSPTVPLTDEQARTMGLPMNTQRLPPAQQTQGDASAYATRHLESPTGVTGTQTGATRTGPEVVTNLMQTGQPGAATAAGKKSGAKPFLILGAVLFLLVLAGAGAFLAWKLTRPAQTDAGVNAGTQTPKGRTGAAETSAATAADLSLNYWLTVQRVRDGKPFKEPFDSSGQEIFENGWKFRLNVSSPKDGYLYLINEGPNERGETVLTVLFPNPLTNSNSAQITANQPLRTPPDTYFDLSGTPGTEKIWIIWSAAPVRNLEAVKDTPAVFADPQHYGEITDPSQVAAVRELFAQHDPSKVQVEKIEKQTNLRGQGDILVYLAKLEHQ